MLPIPSRKHANNLDTWILAKPNSKTSLLHNLNFECGKESRPTKVHARIGSIRKKRITEISRNDAAKITWRQGEIGIKSVGYGNGSDNDSSYRDQSPRITQRDEFTPSLPLHPARIYIYIYVQLELLPSFSQQLLLSTIITRRCTSVTSYSYVAR